MVYRFWQYTLLRLILFFSLFNSYGTLACSRSFFRLSLGRRFGFTSFDVDLFFQIFFANSFPFLLQNFKLFLRKMLSCLLFFQKKKALSAFSCLLGPTRVSCFPTCLKCFFAVLLVRVLNQGQSLRVEHFYGPGDSMCHFVCGFAFREHMKLKDGLNYIVVLDLFPVFARAIKKALVAAEQEVRQIYLTHAALSKNYFVVVENLKAEMSLLAQFFEILTVLTKTDVQVCHRGLGRRNEDFLFENDAVLRRLVGVHIFNWLTTNDFFQLEVLFIADEVELKLTFGRVVGHNTLDQQNIAFVCGRQVQVFNGSRVESHWSFVLVEICLVHNL